MPQKTDIDARLQHVMEVCRQAKITQAEIADAVGASQSQVSRILAGQAQKHSRLLDDVCLYVERIASGGVTEDAVRHNPDLIEAVQAAWDGTAQHAKALSTVIRSLAALKPVVPRGIDENGGQR